MKKVLCNQRGQGLIEYIILVGLMAVASIAVIRVLNHTLDAKFTEAIWALRGRKVKIQTERPTEDLYKKKHLGNFMNGSGER